MSDLARPLAEAAERLFAQRSSAELVNAAERAEWPADLWEALEELGAARLLVPEPRGGAGGDWRDACALLKKAGEHNVPLPLAETLLAAALLARAGLQIPAGPLSFACAGAGARLERAGRGWRLSARLAAVPWASQSAALAIALTGGEREPPLLVCLPRAQFEAVPGRALSGEPRDAVQVSGVELGPEHAAPYQADAFAWAALARTALIAGALRRALALSVEFSRQRVQFGRPIGQFQAVQHHLAVLAEETAAANVACDAAAGACGTPWELACIAAAKTRAGEAAGLGARIAHQIHGAMGITYEHVLHQSTRRLLTWRDECGSEPYWARRLAECFRERRSAGLWSLVSAASARETAG